MSTFSVLELQKQLNNPNSLLFKALWAELVDQAIDQEIIIENLINYWEEQKFKKMQERKEELDDLREHLEEEHQEKMADVAKLPDGLRELQAEQQSLHDAMVALSEEVHEVDEMIDANTKILDEMDNKWVEAATADREQFVKLVDAFDDDFTLEVAGETVTKDEMANAVRAMPKPVPFNKKLDVNPELEEKFIEMAAKDPKTPERIVQHENVSAEIECIGAICRIKEKDEGVVEESNVKNIFAAIAHTKKAAKKLKQAVSSQANAVKEKVVSVALSCRDEIKKGITFKEEAKVKMSEFKNKVENVKTQISQLTGVKSDSYREPPRPKQ